MKEIPHFIEKTYLNGIMKLTNGCDGHDEMRKSVNCPGKPSQQPGVEHV